MVVPPLPGSIPPPPLLEPLISAGAIALLRPLKAVLIALQYRHDDLRAPPTG